MTSNEVRQYASGKKPEKEITSSKILHKRSTDAIVDNYLEYQRIYLFRKRTPFEVTVTPVEGHNTLTTFLNYCNKRLITCLLIEENTNTRHYHGIAWFPNGVVGKSKWKRITEENVNLFVRRLREKYWINYMTKDNPRRLLINDCSTMSTFKELNLVRKIPKK